MRKLFKALILIVTVVLLAGACKKGTDIFTREQDEITVSCIEQTVRQNILCSGEWTATTDSDWMEVSPESGVGNGRDYQFYSISVEYNQGRERSGIVILSHNGKDYEVLVIQEGNAFSIGDASLSGVLFKGIVSTATIQVPYYNASGDESMAISGTVSGAAAEGLSINSITYSSFKKGNGTIEIPIVGTPKKTGKVSISVKMGTEPVKTVQTSVIEYTPGGAVEGFPVRWNFYSAGIDSPASVPAGEKWKNEPHYIYSSHGDNSKAYLTAYSKNAGAGYSFNQKSISMQGFMADDCVLAVIPVKNVLPTTKIKVEGATGGTKTSVGFWVLEYSSDNTTWYIADGIQTIERGGETVQAHFWNTYASINSNGTICKDGSIGNRTSYDKNNPDETYHAYTFALKSISVPEGTLYLRLRSLKWNSNQETLTENLAADKATDIKGFEVSLVE